MSKQRFLKRKNNQMAEKHLRKLAARPHFWEKHLQNTLSIQKFVVAYIEPLSMCWQLWFRNVHFSLPKENHKHKHEPSHRPSDLQWCPSLQWCPACMICWDKGETEFVGITNKNILFKNYSIRWDGIHTQHWIIT